jgi:hypothetical protein
MDYEKNMTSAELFEMALSDEIGGNPTLANAYLQLAIETERRERDRAWKAQTSQWMMDEAKRRCKPYSHTTPSVRF